MQANDLPNQLEEQGANGQKAKAVAAKFPSYYKEDEKDSRYTKHPQEEVEQMVLGILGAYETKVSGRYQPLSMVIQSRYTHLTFSWAPTKIKISGSWHGFPYLAWVPGRPKSCMLFVLDCFA